MEINCFIYFAIIKNIKVEKMKKTIVTGFVWKGCKENQL